MSVSVLQINLKFSVPSEELKSVFASVADDIAAVPGLRWKVWIITEDEREAGGIYLFDDSDSTRAYLAGPMVAGLKTHPALSEISAKQFDVLEDLTALTRGPI